jgi:DNA-binding transcriptional ArsR family regulator
MTDREPYFAAIAALMGDPGRANILAALMDGQALTAKELAHVAGVSAQTASGHLAKLLDGKLLDVVEQGRHRYYRLANSLVACAIEGLMALSAEGGDEGRRNHARRFPAGEALRTARTCYDHLAGRLGVGLTDRLFGQGCLELDGSDYRPTAAGYAVFGRFGIDVDGLKRQRRGFARPCLDWSERRPHLAGALGAALACRCFEAGWIERVKDSRAVIVTGRGKAGFAELFGLALS